MDRAMTFAIHPMKPADEDAVWSILRPVFAAGDAYCLPRDIGRDEALAYWAGGGHGAYVAEAGGAILGTYFLCANQRGGGDHVANCGFATAPEARGRGVARAMLADALARARAEGYAAMQFNFVVSTNAPAIALWRSAGFDEVGRLPGAFRHPELGPVDALVLFRSL